MTEMESYDVSEADFDESKSIEVAGGGVVENKGDEVQIIITYSNINIKFFYFGNKNDQILITFQNSRKLPLFSWVMLVCV